ncbi:ribosome hibernation-promoting factor, HPF/YfiA family [Streptantibioticus silvisoli]|uniref:ribosome hibernation-promoting factor, HPF/YfiA family n=1 Tax=Streptantibioticus silvisoli TaxID=2705255 RepID=UPI00355774DA
MDIVVKGHRTEVPERFRKHVAEKLNLEKIQKLDGKAISLDVELTKEHNPRLHDRCDRVEITLRSRGPVIRAEAAASDPYAALDAATSKLDAQLRRHADKRHLARRGGRAAVSVAEYTAPLAEVPGQDGAEADADRVPHTKAGPLDVEGEGPLVVREKTHVAAAMSLDQALYEMELVGHDFYLFVDSERNQPSVVYRRHGYDYGVIYLKEDPSAIGLVAGAAGGAGGALRR